MATNNPAYDMDESRPSYSALILMGFTKEEAERIDNVAWNIAKAGLGYHPEMIGEMCRKPLPEISLKTRIKFRLIRIEFWMKGIWKRLFHG